MSYGELFIMKVKKLKKAIFFALITSLLVLCIIVIAGFKHVECDNPYAQVFSSSACYSTTLPDIYSALSEIEAFSTTRTAYAGQRIRERDGLINRTIGTLGANVICNVTGKKGIVASYHVVGPMYLRGNDVRDDSNRIIGTHTRGHRFIHLNAGGQSHQISAIDAAFVKFADQNIWNATPLAKGIMNGKQMHMPIRMARAGQIRTNIEILQFGQYTGVTTGILRYTNWSSPAVGQSVIAGRHRYKLGIENLGSYHGDSGGPVFINEGTGFLYLIGFLDGQWSGSLTYFATRISRVTTARSADTSITVGIHSSGPQSVYGLNVTIYCIDVHNLDFAISNGEATVLGVTPGRTNVTDIRIPTHFMGYYVRHIAANAFSNHSGIARICLPNTLHTIGPNAFAPNTTILSGQLHLRQYSYGFKIVGRYGTATSIQIPSFIGNRPILAIGYRAFADQRLHTVAFAANSQVMHIYNSAFMGSALVTLNIPASVKHIGNLAFANNRNLHTVNFGTAIDHSRINFIGDSAFASAINLTTLTTNGAANTLPTNLTYIRRSSFAETGLQHIIIPYNVVYIGVGAFGDSQQLYRVSGGENVRSIREAAFYNTALVYWELDSSKLEIIEQRVFGRTNLVDITLPASLQRIGRDAFGGTAIQAITMLGHARYEPNFWGLPTLAGIPYVFTFASTNWGGFYLPSLRAIYVFACSVEVFRSKWWENASIIVAAQTYLHFTRIAGTGNARVSLRYGAAHPSSIEIPSRTALNGITLTVTEIAANAFEDNRNIVNLTLPSTLSHIGNYAFSGMANLRVIRNYGPTVQQINSSVLAGTNVNQVTMYVVRGLRQSYLNAGWQVINVVDSLLPGDTINLFCQSWAINNAFNSSITAEASELHAGMVVINNITRVIHSAFWNGNRELSLVNPSLLRYGGQITISFWVRMEAVPAGPVYGLSFRYLDGTTSNRAHLARHTGWQYFTIVSTSGRPVIAVELVLNHATWLRLGNVEVTSRNTFYNAFCQGWTINNSFAFGVSAEASETHRGIEINNVTRMAASLFWNGSREVSVVCPQLLVNSGARITISFWVRKEAVPAGPVYGLSFRYLDGSTSSRAPLARHTDWQYVSVTSTSGMPVVAIELVWNHVAWLRFGNVTVAVRG